MRNLVLVTALFAFPACNNDNLMGGMSDMAVSPDMTVEMDMAMRVPNGVMCGNMTCNSPNVCCITPMAGGGVTTSCGAASACADGGVTEACDGPEDCASSTPACCATAMFQLGQGDMGGVTPTGANAMCTSDNACPASVDFNAQQLHTKLCHTEADCAGYSGTIPVLGAADFDGCCTSTQAPGVQFCAPKAYQKIQGMQLYTCN